MFYYVDVSLTINIISVDKNLVNMWIIYTKSLKQPSPTLRGLECEPITPDWINQKGDGSKKRITIRIAALGC